MCRYNLRYLWIGVIVLAVLAVMLPIHAMAYTFASIVHSYGTYFDRIVGHVGVVPITPTTTKPTTTTTTTTQPPTTTTTTTTSTTSTSTTSTSVSTSYSTSTYTVLNGVREYLTWLLKTPQGRCHAGLCMLSKLLSIGMIGSGHGHEHGGEGLGNTIYVQDYMGMFIYPAFGVQPAIVIEKSYTTYVTTTVTRTITQTITTTKTIIENVKTIINSGTGSGGNGGSGSGSGGSGSLSLSINVYNLPPPAGFTGFSGGFNITNIYGRGQFTKGNNVISDTVTGLAALGAAATKGLSDLSYGAGGLFTLAGNAIGNNPVGNAFKTVGKWLNGAGKALYNLSNALLYGGITYNSSTNNVNINIIGNNNPSWLNPPTTSSSWVSFLTHW